MNKKAHKTIWISIALIIILIATAFYATKPEFGGLKGITGMSHSGTSSCNTHTNPATSSAETTCSTTPTNIPDPAIPPSDIPSNQVDMSSGDTALKEFPSGKGATGTIRYRWAVYRDYVHITYYDDKNAESYRIDEHGIIEKGMPTGKTYEERWGNPEPIIDNGVKEAVALFAPDGTIIYHSGKAEFPVASGEATHWASAETNSGLYYFTLYEDDEVLKTIQYNPNTGRFLMQNEETKKFDIPITSAEVPRLFREMLGVEEDVSGDEDTLSEESALGSIPDEAFFNIVENNGLLNIGSIERIEIDGEVKYRVYNTFTGSWRIYDENGHLIREESEESDLGWEPVSSVGDGDWEEPIKWEDFVDDPTLLKIINDLQARLGVLTLIDIISIEIIETDTGKMFAFFGFGEGWFIYNADGEAISPQELGLGQGDEIADIFYADGTLWVQGYGNKNWLSPDKRQMRFIDGTVWVEKGGKWVAYDLNGNPLGKEFDKDSYDGRMITKNENPIPHLPAGPTIEGLAALDWFGQMNWSLKMIHWFETNTFGQVLSGDWENAICFKNIEGAKDEGTLVVQTPDGLATTGAHIEAVRAKIENRPVHCDEGECLLTECGQGTQPDCDSCNRESDTCLDHNNVPKTKTEYIYKITYAITNPEQRIFSDGSYTHNKEPLSFNIRIDGKYLYVDENRERADIELGVGKSNIKGGREAIIITTENLYEKVCLVIEGNGAYNLDVKPGYNLCKTIADVAQLQTEGYEIPERGVNPRDGEPGGRINPELFSAQGSNSQRGDSAATGDVVVSDVFYTSDNLKIHAILCQPRRQGKFPAVVLNHPGYDEAITLEPMCRGYAGLGYVAIASDYRGTGQSQGVHEFAKGEVTDVLNALAYVKSLPNVDKSNMFMFGMSHGGGITYLACERTTDIKAAVVMSGFSNASAININDLPIDDIGGTPDQVPEEYRIRSAINFVEGYRCPTLILHAQDDSTVPVQQADEMYEALKDRGIEVNKNIYPEGGHSLAVHTSDVLSKTFQFFQGHR